MPPGSTYSMSLGMVQTERDPGQNDVGVVAWLLTLKTPESPQGRQVINPFQFRKLSTHFMNSHVQWLSIV